MFFLLLIVQFLTLFESGNSEKQVEIQFIKDYLNKQQYALTVTAFLCWNFDDLQQLAKNLNSNYNGANIQKLPKYNITFPKLPHNLYILDFSCPGTTDILIQANNGFNFRQPNNWLIFENQSYQLSNEKNPKNDIFYELNVFIDTRVVLAKKVAYGSGYNLEYVYKLAKNFDPIYDQFGNWTIGKGFDNFETIGLFWRRRNVRQYPIRVSMIVTDNRTYDHMADYVQNNIDTFTKLNYVLTNSILDFINATLKMVFVPTWYKINSKDQNGTLIGTIINRDVEITGTPFFCMPERITWMDCIAMTTPAVGFFIFRQPPLSYVKNIYILPFGTELWVADISFLLLSAILLYWFVSWEWKILEETNENPEYDMIHKTFSDSLLFTMGAVCQQGYATEPKGTPGKILILTVFITLIFLFTAYTAYTVVLFQATANNIRTLKDLYESPIVLGLEDRAYNRELFPRYKEPIRRKIYQEKIAPKGQKAHYYNLTEGIAKMRHEFFAFHIDGITGYKAIQDTFMENEKCGFQQIPYLQESDPYVISPKNVPFREYFYIGYRKLVESGLYKREIKKRTATKPECSGEGNNFRSAGILDLYSVYMLLIIGVVCSLFLLFCEVTSFKFVAQYNSRKIALTL